MIREPIYKPTKPERRASALLSQIKDNARRAALRDFFERTIAREMHEGMCPLYASGFALWCMDQRMKTQ